MTEDGGLEGQEQQLDSCTPSEILLIIGESTQQGKS
jgi:hypothetical protein